MDSTQSPSRPLPETFNALKILARSLPQVQGDAAVLSSNFDFPAIGGNVEGVAINAAAPGAPARPVLWFVNKGTSPFTFTVTVNDVPSGALRRARWARFGATVGGTGVMVYGWGLDQQDASLTFQLLIDGNVVSSTPERYARPDVCNAYPSVSHCASSQPGATFSWNSMTVGNGSHTIALRLIDPGGLSTTLGTRTIAVSNGG